MKYYSAIGKDRQTAISEVVNELRFSGLDDTQIAARLNDMGFVTLCGTSWTAAKIKDVEEWFS